MLDCFRTGGANNPETFIAAVAAVLSKYPDEVVYAITGSSGLPLQLTWMPSVKEVHDACEKAMEPIYRKEREARIVAETIANRAEPDRTGRPSREELQAKHGPNWGLHSLDEKPKANTFKPMTPEQLAEHYGKYGLRFQKKEREE